MHLLDFSKKTKQSFHLIRSSILRNVCHLNHVCTGSFFPCSHLELVTGEKDEVISAFSSMRAHEKERVLFTRWRLGYMYYQDPATKSIEICYAFLQGNYRWLTSSSPLASPALDFRWKDDEGLCKNWVRITAMFAKLTFAHHAIYSEKCTVMDPLEGCAEILDFIFTEGCSEDS